MARGQGPALCRPQLRNRERKAPKHAPAEIRADFHRIVYAETAAGARTAYAAFARKWAPRCPGVVRSLHEGGEEGLRALGYVEGKTIIAEVRSAEGRADQIPALAAELVQLNVDVLVAGGPEPLEAARKATNRIPIVMVAQGDVFPVEDHAESEVLPLRDDQLGIVAGDAGGDRLPAPAGGGGRFEREPVPVADLDRVAAVPSGQELQVSWVNCRNQSATAEPVNKNETAGSRD